MDLFSRFNHVDRHLMTTKITFIAFPAHIGIGSGWLWHKWLAFHYFTFLCHSVCFARSHTNHTLDNVSLAGLAFDTAKHHVTTNCKAMFTSPCWFFFSFIHIECDCTLYIHSVCAMRAFMYSMDGWYLTIKNKMQQLVLSEACYAHIIPIYDNRCLNVVLIELFNSTPRCASTSSSQVVWTFHLTISSASVECICSFLSSLISHGMRDSLHIFMKYTWEHQQANETVQKHAPNDDAFSLGF